MSQNNIYKTAVVVPTYNNPKTISKVALDVLSYGYTLVIVDDGSSIEVSSLVEEHQNIHIVKHPQNMGKGQAILSGAAKVKKLGFDYFVSMDGDGQHLASELSKLIELIDSRNQIVIGARNFNIENVPTISKVGRAYHNFWIKLNSGYDITDSLTGFRLYPISILELGLKRQRFDFEVEVLVKHYWKHKKISDKIVECYYPTPEERVSHFNNYKDTVTITLLHLNLFLKRFILLKGFFS